MRVTNKMLANTVLNNLHAGLKRLQKLQDQMSSGQIISKPSDDPVIGTRVMTLNSVMKQRDQYERNIDDAIGWMDTTEKALGSLNDALQRARVLALSGASDNLSQTDREALVKEVEELKNNVLQIANTSYANRYVFAGTKTTAEPFDDLGNYSGNSGAVAQLNWEVSQGMTVAVNVDGNDAFVVPGIFNILDDLRADLLAGDTNRISNTDLARIDNAIDNTLNLRAALGAKMNRLEMAKSRSSDEMINYEQLIAKLNDVDMAKIITDFTMQENVYLAALNAGARIVQNSLLDFLR
ncbi:MAG TPA: flagellar hook-associated protein FlgL [Bacillota bacterium]|nr:flagellar hook-associated protein FlgL [Bacillota bacterium]